METPPLPRDKRKGPAVTGAATELVTSFETSSGPQPAADWICVAAARNVLVVDDNDRHLDILSTILTSVGHDVETCGSGAEALRRLDMRRYDVVVLDLVMPEVSGFVVATQMRSMILNKRTPVIFCTANMTAARRQLADVKGVTAIIGKPIDTANLILAVSRAPVREREQRRSDQIRI
ncbi:MAG: response regulator [Alphaproteobacteria bacterium]|jgi:two-component system sensor histidine kinase/response regulator|nr:MAG: response regulator [Alphaproteobacteria bacterium]